MKVAKNTFLVQVDAAKKSTLDIVGINGQKIVIDVDYNKYKHSVQIGKVYAGPIQITSEFLYDTILNIGDTVVFHHLVCEPKNKMFDGVYRCDYFNIFAKIDNDMIEPIEDLVFVDPIKEAEEDLFCGAVMVRNTSGNVKQRGKVFALSNKARQFGIEAGDIVHFTKNADYEMKLVDKILYRMRVRNIICVERNGLLVCPSDKICVMRTADFKLDKFKEAQEHHQLRGEVIGVGEKLNGVVCQEDSVDFFAPIDGCIRQAGTEYYFVEPRHINYIHGTKSETGIGSGAN